MQKIVIIVFEAIWKFYLNWISLHLSYLLFDNRRLEFMGIALADYEEKVLENLYVSGGVGVFVNVIKAKIKASAWKTIRKTQYDNYEDYFQVFRGFSKKSYPEILQIFLS